jgi:Transcriptional regulators
VINKNMPYIYNYLQEIAWYFGSHGINGECCGELSLVEFMALKKVCENPDNSIQEIGNALNFTKSGATRIINRLENKGYVVRENSSIDGRVCCVSTTVKGSQEMKKIMDKYTNYLDDVLNELEPQMIENIYDVLEVLVKALQQKKHLA